MTPRGRHPKKPHLRPRDPIIAGIMQGLLFTQVDGVWVRGRSYDLHFELEEAANAMRGATASMLKQYDRDMEEARHG